VATIDCADFGTFVSRLVMKCVRQRCRAGAAEDGADDVLEALVGVRDDELQPSARTRSSTRRAETRLHIGLLDDGDQRLLGAPAWLQEGE